MIDIAPVSRELLEAVTALLAVVVLVVVSFWLVVAARAPAPHGVHARARGERDGGRDDALAFVGLGFTAVYREGFETVLFYQALALFAEGLGLWVSLGAVAAAVALGGVALRDPRLGKQLPLKPMLISGAVDPAAAVGRLRRQRGALAAVGRPARGDAGRLGPRLPVFLAELTGIHPTQEGLIVQAVLLAVYVLGALYVFAWQPARRRRRVASRDGGARRRA